MLSVLISFATAGAAHCQGIYGRKFWDIDGAEVNLRADSGKKLLFIILPADAPDSFATQLKSFVAMYSSKVTVIGVLTQDSGQQAEDKQAIKAAYQGTGVLLTEVMSSHKGSGQSRLMQWLTKKQENGHFDLDVKDPGQKFFVNGRGRLYAVLGSRVPLSSPFIGKVVNAAETDGQPIPVRRNPKTASGSKVNP